MTRKDKIINTISAKLWQSLGAAIEVDKSHRYEIRPLNNEWWIFHNGVGSGEPLVQWIESVLNDIEFSIDVPDNTEIYQHCEKARSFVGIAKWMRDTIILRNL